MAWSSPLQTVNATATTLSITPGATGNLIVLYSYNTSAVIPSGVTVTGGAGAGTAFTKLVSQARTGQFAGSIFAVIAPAGMTGLSVAGMSGTTYLASEEYSGAPTTLATDGSSSADGGTTSRTTFSPGTFVAAVAGDLLLFLQITSGSMGTVSGITGPVMSVNGSAFSTSSAVTANMGLVSGGSVNPTCTWTTSRRAADMCAAVQGPPPSYNTGAGFLGLF